MYPPARPQSEIALVLVACAILVGAPACVSNRAVDKALKRSAVLPDPVPVGRPVNEALRDFSDMLTAYQRSFLGEKVIPIEIAVVPNDPDKELPIDLGPYVRAVVDLVGRP